MIVQTYGADANRTDYPTLLSLARFGARAVMLAMTLDRAGLERAAAVAIRQGTADMPLSAPANGADK